MFSSIIQDKNKQKSKVYVEQILDKPKTKIIWLSPWKIPPLVNPYPGPLPIRIKEYKAISFQGTRGKLFGPTRYARKLNFLQYSENSWLFITFLCGCPCEMKIREIKFHLFSRHFLITMYGLCPKCVKTI